MRHMGKLLVITSWGTLSCMSHFLLQQRISYHLRCCLKILSPDSISRHLSQFCLFLQLSLSYKPQLRHFPCIQYGCGKQSVVVYSLNNVIIHHFIATLTPNYQNLGQLCQHNSVRRVHPYAYHQQVMLLKHFPFIQYGCGKQSVVIYSLNNVIMPSFHATLTPNYQNVPHLPV